MSGILELIGAAELIVTGLHEIVTRTKAAGPLLNDLLSAHSAHAAVHAELCEIRDTLKDRDDDLSQVAKQNVYRQVEKTHAELNSLKSVITDLDSDLHRGRVHHFTRMEAITQRIHTVNTVAEKTAMSCQLITSELDIVSSIADIVRNALRLRSTASTSTAPGSSSFSGVNLVPCVPRNVVLDFELDKPPGVSLSREALIKKRVLDLAKTNTHGVTAITGISGMGGIGKSVALKGLVNDKEVQEYFVDGVYFVQLSQDAEDRVLIDELVEIVRKTGGSSEADDVQTSQTPSDAARKVAFWFRDATALFVFDDLPSSPSVPDGFVSALRILVHPSTNKRCCLVISTRDRNVALLSVDEPIRFEPLMPTEPRSVEILLQRANHAMGLLECGPLQYELHGEKIDILLGCCAGVPLTLAVIGSALCEERNVCDDWESTLESYEKLLSDYSSELFFTADVTDYPQSLEQVLRCSIAGAEDFDHTRGGRRRQQMRKIPRPSAMMLFIRLCVLPKQSFITRTVLQHLWSELNPREVGQLRRRLISLGLFNAEGREVTLVRIHDHVMDFCDYEARRLSENSSGRSVFKECHTTFLSSYRQEPCQQASASTLIARVEANTREWWELQGDDDLIIIQNLPRLLQNADRVTELIGVVSHGSWTRMRMKHGGMSALMSDFSLCLAAVRSTSLHIVAPSLKLISDTISDMGFLLVKDTSRLGSDAYNRLFNKADEHGLIERFMRTCRLDCCSSWLRAVHPFMPPSRGHGLIEVPTGIRDCTSIAVNWEHMRVFVLGQNCRVKVNISDRKVENVHVLPETCEGPPTDQFTEMLSISTEGRFIARRMDRTVFVYDVMSKRDIFQHALENFIVRSRFSPTGDKIVLISTTHTGENEFLVLAVPSGATVRRERDTHFGTINDVSFSPDGSELWSVSRDGVLQCWDMASSREPLLFEFTHENGPAIPLLKVVAGKNVIVAWGWGDEIGIWRRNLRNGIVYFEKTLCARGIVRTSSLDTTIWSGFSLSPDEGRLLFYGSHHVHIIELASGQLVCSVPVIEHVVSIVVSHNSRAVMLDDKGLVRFWKYDAVTTETVAIPPRHTSSVSHLGFNVDSGSIISAVEKEAVTISSLEDLSKKLIAHDISEIGPSSTRNAKLLALSPDGLYLALAWDTGWLKRFACSQPSTITNVSADPELLPQVLCERNVDNTKPPYSKSKRWVALAMSAGSRRIIAMQRSGKLLWWDSDGKLVHEKKSKVVVSRMGATLVLCARGTRAISCVDDFVEFWDEENESAKCTIEWSGHTSPMGWVESISLSEDGELAVFADRCGVYMRTWSQPWVTFACVSNEFLVKRPIVSCSQNGSVVIWAGGANNDNLIRAWSLDRDEENHGSRWKLEEIGTASLPRVPTCAAHGFVGENEKGVVAIGDDCGHVALMEIS